jgi:acyl-CoA synthetase (AMP-forming)/AMP-acid ligase II
VGSTAIDGTVGDHNVAALHEAIAVARGGEGDCVIAGSRHLSWAEVTDRSRRLATVLRAAGLGLRADQTAVKPWTSPHDHVALYLYNSLEYLEGMLGAWKARCAPINVNYRYVAAELAYLLRDSGARAVVVGGQFVDTLAEVLPELPEVRLVLQVDDGSGAPLLPGATPYEEALAAAEPATPEGLSPDDRYIVYTGGTTGMPKGVLWRQGDFLATCLGISGTEDELVAAAARRSSLRTLPAAPLMHGAAHWNAISAWISGGTVVLPHDPSRFDPADVLATCARERASALQIVGDPFARPLLDEVHRAERAGEPYDLSGLRFLLSGGAVLSAPVKAELREAIPGLRIVDVLGSSETGRQAVGGDDGAAFTPSAAATVLSEDRSRLLDPVDADPAEQVGRDRHRDRHDIGWLAQRGRVPLGYLGDPEKTAATFPVIDGVRYAVAGDRVRWSAEGRIELLGRDSVTINTGGEKVYAEEVEQALTSHPAIHDAVVVGRPDPRWGQEVVAVAATRTGAEPPADDELRTHCRTTLAGYKVPKAIFWVEQVHRFPTGKPDYAWARGVVSRG